MLALAVGTHAQAVGPTPIAVCDDAHVRAAAAAGGDYVFACNATIDLTAEIVVSKDLSLDGGGHAVTLRPGSFPHFRLFRITGGDVALSRLKLYLGYANPASAADGADGGRGTNSPTAGPGTPGGTGGAGGPGGNGGEGGAEGAGGALRVEGGTVTLVGDLIDSNGAGGQNGGWGGEGGDGGQGGGHDGEQFGYPSQCPCVAGGDGGPGGAGGHGGNSGPGRGGAIFVASGATVSLKDGAVTNNSAISGGAGGGDGGEPGGGGSGACDHFGSCGPFGAFGVAGTGGDGGSASLGQGGAIYNAGTLVVNGTRFSDNRAESGGAGGGRAWVMEEPKGAGGDGGNSADAAGGAIYNTGSLQLTGAHFDHNRARSVGGGGGIAANISGAYGFAGDGGDAGDARGGAIFTTVATGPICATFADNVVVSTAGQDAGGPHPGVDGAAGTAAGPDLSGPLGACPAPMRALTVGLAGAGNGTVTGPGIACPGTCSRSFADGTAVTLTAHAAGGSAFAGWSGACTGTGACNVTMSAARSVTASFKRKPPSTTLTSHPAKTVTLKPGRSRRRVTFGFAATGASTGFRCKLDKNDFAPCESPRSYRLKRGEHTFAVRAVGPGGVDPTPAMFAFRVVKPSS